MNEIITKPESAVQELSPPEPVYGIGSEKVSLVGIGEIAPSGYRLKSSLDIGWMGGVACERGDADVMFAEDGVSRSSRARDEAAKKICNVCPMEEPCLQYALLNKIEDGVWGGTTSSERKKLHKKLKQLASQ